MKIENIMNISILHLGSNEGNRLKNLQDAIKLIESNIGEICKQSAIYETEAWGVKEQEDFLNMVVKIKSQQSPHALLKQINEIEEELGRTRFKKWGSRIIDIDILFYENECIKDEKLTIPHPYLEKRNFVLVPLNEIAADLVHPILNKKISVLLKESKDICRVSVWAEGK